jgi:hypothetical protein
LVQNQEFHGTGLKEIKLEDLAAQLLRGTLVKEGRGSEGLGMAREKRGQFLRDTIQRDGWHKVGR